MLKLTHLELRVGKIMFNSHYTDKYSYFSGYKSSVWYYNGCYLGEHPFIVAQNEGHFYPHLYFFVIVPKNQRYIIISNI